MRCAAPNEPFVMKGVLVARDPAYMKSAPDVKASGTVIVFDWDTSFLNARRRGSAPSFVRVVVRIAGIARPEVAMRAPAMTQVLQGRCRSSIYTPERTPDDMMPNAAAALAPSKWAPRADIVRD